MSVAQDFGPYTLLERINFGGTAEVSLAVEKRSKRRVAIKRLLPSVASDLDASSMFRDEVAIMSQLDHPHIAKVIGSGQVGGSLYLELEYVQGKDARDLLEKVSSRGEVVPVDIAVGIALAVCDALAYAHKKKSPQGKPLGIIHRDVSLQNIMLGFDGTVKLVDFGIAKVVGRMTSTTQNGQLRGKLGYMAPEHAAGREVDARADLFGLGVCLWELLTGSRLYTGRSEEQILDMLLKQPATAPGLKVRGIPEALDRVVIKSLAKQPNDRYADATDFFADLNALARAEGLNVTPTQLATFLRQSFRDDPALTKSVQESRTMADNKGGSDLDVFEGLAKKSNPRPSGFPAPAVPPSSGARPMPPPSGGLPPPGMPSSRPKTMLGLAPPPMGNVTPGAALPPPSGALPPPRQSVPPVGAPSRGGLPAPLPPPSMGRPNVLPPVSAPPPRTSGLPGMPPPAVAAPAPGKPAVEMDWDDEDEKTSIYDKDTTQEAMRGLGIGGPGKPLPAAGMPAPLPAPPPSQRPNLGSAAALMAGSGGAAAAAPPPAYTPPPSLRATPPPAAYPVPQVQPPPGAVQAQVPSRAEPTQVVRAQPSGGGKGVIFAVVGLVAVAAIGIGAFFALQPKTGNLLVVAKSGGQSLDKAEVSIGDKKYCDTLPCSIPKLEKGIVNVKVTSEGYKPSSEVVTVRAGEDSAVTLNLEKAAGTNSASSAAVAAAGTGFKATGPAHIKMSIDGKEVGPLPQEIKDAAPGEHKIKFASSERYKADERTVTIGDKEVKDLGTIKLDVIKGKATLNLGTPGASVMLVSGAERKAVRQFPISIDIDTTRKWSIEATKAGFENFKQDIGFDDGEAEKTFSITLFEKGKTPKPDAPSTEGGGDKPTPEKQPETGNGTLNINSIPPSNCILDGRPLGMTPKAGVSVPAGTHSVTFIHPEKGKQATSVTVKAGETKSVGVKFP